MYTVCICTVCRYICIYIMSMPANSCIVLHMSQHVALPSHFSYACCLGSQGALDAAQGYLRTTRIATWRKNNYLPCINFVCDLWEGSGVCLWGVPGISYLLGWPLPLPDRYIYIYKYTYIYILCICCLHGCIYIYMYIFMYVLYIYIYIDRHLLVILYVYIYIQHIIVSVPQSQ